MRTENVSLFYGKSQALKGVTLSIPRNQITAIIGPSGCGKSSFLRLFNRMNDLIISAKVEGQVFLDEQPIYAPKVDVVELRKKIGMVFQKPNPFPMSVFDNVAYGPRVHGIKERGILEEIVEKCLKQAALWEEVKDKLRTSALSLSGGQQQRLCIARVLAVEPEVILLDEPCSALDPISTMKIEDLMQELKKDYTLIIVTHNMQQAARASDFTAFLLAGELIEFGVTKELFTSPRDPRTEGYITGRWG
ncbi:MAG: phosphate ABC transporter ATP-binding protein PstB [Caldiserica bacterium]|nr:phosphate ABC transporter ATP-binding protein PstB [Caldisericota bacterium]MDH7562610.1 phosphate ABC transporter ATP-binding protein PstB [Caldisericota bacterium]